MRRALRPFCERPITFLYGFTLPTERLVVYQFSERSFGNGLALKLPPLPAFLHSCKNSGDRPPAGRTLARPELFCQAIQEFSAHQPLFYRLDLPFWRSALWRKRPFAVLAY